MKKLALALVALLGLGQAATAAPPSSRFNSIAITGQGSTGDVSGMSVTPNGSSAATLSALLKNQLTIDSNGVVSVLSGPTLGTYQNGQFTSQPDATTGDVSGASATAAGATAARLLSERASDAVSILDFGGKADFNGTTGTDNAAAQIAAMNSGKCARFPVGRYYFATTPALPAGKPLCILGDGKEQTTLVFGTGATNGLVAAPSSYLQAVVIRGLTLATLGNETGSAIKISYPDADVNLYPFTERVVIDDVAIRGLTSLATGWTRGIDLYNTQWFYISDYNITGRRTNSGATAADYQHMTDGIYAGYGAQVSGGGFISRGQIYDAVNAVNVQSLNNAQGFNISQFNFVEVGNGVVQNNVTDGPGLTVNDGHMNVFNTAIAGTHVPDSVFGNLLLYKNPVGTAETVGFALSTSSYTNIANVVLKNQTNDASVSGGFVGARFTDSSYIGLDNIQIERPSIGVDIAGSSSQVTGTGIKVVGTLTNGNTVFSRDTSTGSGQNILKMEPFFAAYTNSADVTSTSTGGQAVASATLNVLAGQRYRVTTTVETVNGATAGDALLTVYKAAGTATATFGNNATQMKERRAVGASADVVQNVSGVMTVTASGTLQVGALIQTTGSNGTVSAGNAQLTVESF